MKTHNYCIMTGKVEKFYRDGEALRFGHECDSMQFTGKTLEEGKCYLVCGWLEELDFDKMLHIYDATEITGLAEKRMRARPKYEANTDVSVGYRHVVAIEHIDSKANTAGYAYEGFPFVESDKEWCDEWDCPGEGDYLIEGGVGADDGCLMLLEEKYIKLA